LGAVRRTADDAADDDDLHVRFRQLCVLQPSSVRAKGPGAPEIVDRQPGLAACAVSPTAQVESIGKIRIERDHLVKIGDRDDKIAAIITGQASVKTIAEFDPEAGIVVTPVGRHAIPFQRLAEIARDPLALLVNLSKLVFCRNFAKASERREKFESALEV